MQNGVFVMSFAGNADERSAEPEKAIRRRVARMVGGSRADVWPGGPKSSAYEIKDHYDAAWRREWLKRGLGFVALRGPLGRLP